MTNLLPILVIVVSTNWVNVSGDIRIEGGTNYFHQRQIVLTNVVLEEVELRTNRTVLKQMESSSTNAPERWVPVSKVGQPPLPGQSLRE